MKTFYFAISFLALLGSPVSCAIEEMNNNSQPTSQIDGDTENSTDIDPPIPAQIPR